MESRHPIEPRADRLGYRHAESAAGLASRGGVASVGGDEPGIAEGRLLGLRAAECDAVSIITAAQVRLRRWRRRLSAGNARIDGSGGLAAVDRIRRIVAARDVLLRQGCRIGCAARDG